MPKTATTFFFFTNLLNFFVSPWSPCQNATYVFEEETIFSILVKGHPGEIFSTFVISPWSQCQKRRPLVNFLALSETFFGKSVKSVSKCHIWISEKKYPFLLVKDHPWENFILCPWSQCLKRQPQVNFFANLLNFFVSPWSPCPNATYEFEKKNILYFLWKATLLKILLLLS